MERPYLWVMLVVVRSVAIKVDVAHFRLATGSKLDLYSSIDLWTLPSMDLSLLLTSHAFLPNRARFITDASIFSETACRTQRVKYFSVL
jgi:hypothetical protein